MLSRLKEHVANFISPENTPSRLIKAGFVRQVNESLILVLYGCAYEQF